MFRSLAFIFVFFIVSLSDGQDARSFSITVSVPQSEGFYFFSPLRIGMNGNKSLPMLMLLDAKGNIIYYKHFNKGPYCGIFKLNPDNTMTYYLDGYFYIMDKSFKVIDSITTKNGVELDGHEFIKKDNGHCLLLGTETITMDLSSYNLFKNHAAGSKHAKVICGVIQELDANKNVVFEWHSKDHYSFDDMDETYTTDTLNVDWMHFNALDYDMDGNILVSSKKFNEITKVDRKTGKIMWRLGGKKNQFRFLNDDFKFLGQHDVKQNVSGTISLFDNGRPGFPFHPEGAKEYLVDGKAMTAELVWSFINDPGHCSEGYGSVQILKDHKTIINYGRHEKSNVLFNVVDIDKNKKFEVVSLDSLSSYRTYYYRELPWNISRPKIKVVYEKTDLFLELVGDIKEFKWSTGEKTRRIRPEKEGKYTVSIPFGDGGYLVSEPFFSGNSGK